jgi:D-alanyl-lipoteichoic acid acyltransferase DltB (MBOAT superfamily)
MFFISTKFIIFFIVLFLLYYLIFNGRRKVQNWLLLLASLFFYGCANIKMVAILVISILLFYWLGREIRKHDGVRRASVFKTLGVVFGVGILLYFKYLNFFIDSFSSLFESFGLHTNHFTFNIIMPLGVSYFTFKLISYVIEVYHRKIEPSRDIVQFATYISFFPTIMAGPIDRPQFMSQLSADRLFDYSNVTLALKRILWGVFLKTCVADRLAVYTDTIFANVSAQNGTSLSFACMLYTLQMYADFCGYSDMAIGIAQVFGIKCRENFMRPLFSTNLAELWRKWHMSLTTWVTDYVFTPLNIKFRNWGNFGILLAIWINMVIIGMWHGANWKYALFGTYHTLLFIPLILTGVFFKHANKGKSSIRGFWDWPRVFLVFILWSIGMIFFRSNDSSEALVVIRKIFSEPGAPYICNKLALAVGIISAIVMLFRDVVYEFNLHFHLLHSRYLIVRYITIVILLYYIFFFAQTGATKFIYFQF